MPGKKADNQDNPVQVKVETKVVEECMQNRQPGFSRKRKTVLYRYFHGSTGMVIKKVTGVVVPGVILILSLIVICYILIGSSLFNPSLKIDNDAIATVFMFFSLAVFAGAACYAVYLFLGIWGVYNTRLFRSMRTVFRMVKNFIAGLLPQLYRLITKQRERAGHLSGYTAGFQTEQNRNFLQERPVLYNDYRGSPAGNTAAANFRLLLTVSVMVIASRLFIFFIGYLAHVYFNKINIGFFESFKDIWVRWDSNHYIFLADKWYTNQGDDRLLIVFFPLYSILIKFVKIFVPNTIVSGILVSNICLIFTCFYLVKLVEPDYGQETGFRVVKYLLIYPFSFFLSIVFTESLFLMLLVMFFYYMRKKDWLLAGFLGFFASLSRLYGILLLVPACAEVVLSSEFKSFIRSWDWKKYRFYLLKICVFLLLIPAGIIVYLCLNKAITGDWFRFLEYQRNHWTNEFGFIGNTLKGIMSGAINPREGFESRICLWWPAISSFVLALSMMLYGIRKMRITYILFMIVYTYIAYSPSWLISAERYMLVLFPMYIPLAVLGRKKWADTVITVGFSALLCYCIFLFTVIGMLC